VAKKAPYEFNADVDLANSAGVLPYRVSAGADEALAILVPRTEARVIYLERVANGLFVPDLRSASVKRTTMHRGHKESPGFSLPGL